MESLLPQLFTFTFFVPTVLRIAAALAFASLAHNLYKQRADIAALRFPIIGTAGRALTWTAIGGFAALAFLFATGFLTQAAALLGIATSVKGSILAKRYPTLFPQNTFAYLLLAAICLAILVSGAGAFAIDKPY